MSLSKTIRTFINNHPAGEALIAADIVEYNLPESYTEEEEKKIRQNVYVILNRFLNTSETFKRFDTGIYYRIDENVKEISIPSLIDRLFIENDKGEKYGYFSGEAFAYLEGYREKRPEAMEIVSNYWRRKIDPSLLGIKVLAPPVEVTSENVLMLQLLDIFKWKPHVIKDLHVRKLIVQYILKNKIDTTELISLAVQHTNKKAVLSLVQLIPDYVEACKNPALALLPIY